MQRFAIVSSKSGTAWWSWVLTPQTNQSPKDGICRSKITGRGLVRPSACGSGVSETSPSLMA
ncbi:MAG: hypothetical protein ABI042_10925 [Verrucomicrobiota bacterium]